MTFLSSITLVLALSSGGPSFVDDVKPIFSKKCATCHSKVVGLPNLLDYSTAFSLRNEIQVRVEERSMPHLGRITESERDVITQWVLTGAAE